MTNALICARKNSKGLFGKNLRLLGGVPLIVHSINTAQQIPLIDRIYVSTDCPIIAETALNSGAEVPFLRPGDLAEDTSSEWLVWRHAIKHFFDDKASPMVVLPPTGPLRTLKDVSKAINLFNENNCDIVITTVASHRNPNFNMVRSGDNGMVSLAQPSPSTYYRRQDAPEYFDITTNCYVVNPTFVMEKSGIFDGVVKQIVVLPENAVDIDSQLDLDWAEFLMARTRKQQ
jgi:N,N'-diacetyl-8-epilegionaminate cytidylyltransferase